MSKYEKLLEENNVNVAKLATSLNMMYLSIDNAHAYCFDVEDQLKNCGLYRNRDKQLIKKIKSDCEELVKSVTNTLSKDDLKFGFGDLADFLLECQKLLILCKTEEQQKQMIKALCQITNSF